eukprot:tig00021366_g20841.t1
MALEPRLRDARVLVRLHHTHVKRAPVGNGPAYLSSSLRRASDPTPYPTGFGALVPPASLDLAARESVEGSVAGSVSVRGAASRSLRLGPAYLPSASLLSKLPFASGASVKGDRSGARRPRSSRRIAPEIPAGSELDAGGSGAEPSCRGSGSWGASGAGALRRSSRSRGPDRDRDLDREPGDPESAAAATRPRPSARRARAARPFPRSDGLETSDERAQLGRADGRGRRRLAIGPLAPLLAFLKYLANDLGSSAELRGRYALRGASVAVLAAGFAASRLLSRSPGPLRRRLRWVAAAAVHAQVAAVAAGPVLSYLDHAFGFVGLEVAALGLSAAARTVN